MAKKGTDTFHQERLGARLSTCRDSSTENTNRASQVHEDLEGSETQPLLARKASRRLSEPGTAVRPTHRAAPPVPTGLTDVCRCCCQASERQRAALPAAALGPGVPLISWPQLGTQHWPPADSRLDLPVLLGVVLYLENYIFSLTVKIPFYYGTHDF